MIKFTETNDGYVFTIDNEALAIGIHEQGQFHLLHKDTMVSFGNAMQAFCHLRSIYEPSVASPKTLEMFNTPARAIDNMSKYSDNAILKDMPIDVFHATT